MEKDTFTLNFEELMITKMPPRRSQWFYHGFWAGVCRAYLDECPYRKGTVSHDDWIAGRDFAIKEVDSFNT